MVVADVVVDDTATNEVVIVIQEVEGNFFLIDEIVFIILNCDLTIFFFDLIVEIIDDEVFREVDLVQGMVFFTYLKMYI